jgi:hypothetical protein
MALTDNLIHGWNMNNDWLDAFGSADGTAVGATFSSPAPLGSHEGEGDGIDDLVSFGNNLNFDYTDAFSISFIFTPKDLIGTQMVASKMTSGNVGWEIYTASAGLYFRLIQVYSSKTLEIGPVTVGITTQHIVCTYDGSNNTSGMKIYKDNSSSSPVLHNNAIDSSIINAENFVLLARSYSAFFSNLKIDAVYVWNREITSSEVSALYNGGSYLELLVAVAFNGYPFFYDGGHY